MSASTICLRRAVHSVCLYLHAVKHPRDTDSYSVYHIHVNPVAPNGSCSTVGGHLDPYNATDLVKCNMTEQDKCQVGDLSGKHGKANTSAFSARY